MDKLKVFRTTVNFCDGSKSTIVSHAVSMSRAQKYADDYASTISQYGRRPIANVDVRRVKGGKLK